MKRKTALRTLAIVIFSTILFACVSGLLFGCGGGKDEKRKMTNLYSEGLDIYYLLGDEIDFEKVSLVVEYEGGVRENLTKKEFDVEKAQNPDTEFILYTDGLYEKASEGRGLEKGDYDISCEVLSTGAKADLFTLTVGDDYLDELDVLLFSDPEFVSVYRDNVSNRVGEGEDSFMDAEEYFVGDDNGFEFRPELTVYNQRTDALGYFSSFKVETKVSSEGKTLTENNSLVSYDDFTFFFAEAAEGKKFTLEMTLDEFEFSGDRTCSFDVTVADGWNVFDACEIGKMNLVSSSFNRSDFVTGDDWKSCGVNGEGFPIFWDPEEGSDGGLVYKDEVKIWEDFLTEKGVEIGPVNGVFLHGDITLTNDDIPEDFVISEEEAAHFGCDYDEMIGSLRDYVMLYEKNVEEDFVFNGNFFTIDCSGLKWGMTHTELEDDLEYYPENYSGKYSASNSVLFSFQGLTDISTPAGERHTVVMKNVSVKGNAIDRNETEGKAAGGLRFLHSRSSRTVVENSVVREFLYGFQSTNSDHSFTNLTLDGVKIYDSYYSAVYVATSAENEIKNSEISRAGGPAIRSLSSVDKINDDGDAVNYEAGVTLDESTTVTNFVDGTEAWFVINDAGAVATYINLVDLIFMGVFKKTVTDDDGKINLIYMSFADGLFDAEQHYMNSVFSYGDAVPFVYNESTITGEKNTLGDFGGDTSLFNAAKTNYYIDNYDALIPAVFETNLGTIFAMDNGMTGMYDPKLLVEGGEASPLDLTADDNVLCLYYKMGSAGFSIVVDMYDL
ncbi:MAG: right-handed parallel beta-helix repeat-containing protein [Clostridia bacterium]|nr:right-handed parallel beta-helix repeat-containing protein [Clostridia bacterium]